MTVLITGGSGFLGAWVIGRLLRRGVPIRVFDVTDNRGLIETDHRTRRKRDRLADRRRQRGGRGRSRRRGLRRDRPPRRPLDPGMPGRSDPRRADQSDRHLERVRSGQAPAHEQGRLHEFGQRVRSRRRQGAVPDHALRRLQARLRGLRPHLLGIRSHDERRAAARGGLRAGARDRPHRRSEPRLQGCRRGQAVHDRLRRRDEHGLCRRRRRDDRGRAAEPLDGAHVFNALGEVADVEDVIAAIRRHEPAAQIGLAGRRCRSPRISRATLHDLLPGLPHTRLAEGIAATIEHYRRQRGARSRNRMPAPPAEGHPRSTSVRAPSPGGARRRLHKRQRSGEEHEQRNPSEASRRRPAAGAASAAPPACSASWWAPGPPSRPATSRSRSGSFSPTMTSCGGRTVTRPASSRKPRSWASTTSSRPRRRPRRCRRAKSRTC